MRLRKTNVLALLGFVVCGAMLWSLLVSDVGVQQGQHMGYAPSRELHQIQPQPEPLGGLSNQQEDVANNPYSGASTVLSIHVVATHDLEHLMQLFESLADSARPSESFERLDANIPITVSSTFEISDSERQRLMNMWATHGTVSVLPTSPRASVLLSHWISGCPQGGSSNAACLTLSDDIILAPAALNWCFQMLTEYNERKHIMGASLLKPQTDNVQGWHIVSRGPYLHVDPGHSMYLAFPEHWSGFRTWARRQLELGNKPYDPADMASKEAFDNMLSRTTWYRSDMSPVDVARLWQAWLLRYCTEQSLYTMYVNLGTKGALAIKASPEDEVMVARGDSLLPAGLTSLDTSDKALRSMPTQLRHYDWEGAVVPQCTSSSCGGNGGCSNSLQGYQCRCSSFMNARDGCSSRPLGRPWLSIVTVTDCSSPEHMSRFLRGVTVASYSGNDVRLTVYVSMKASAMSALGLFQGDELSDWVQGSIAQGYAGDYASQAQCLDVLDRWRWQHGHKRVVVVNMDDKASPLGRDITSGEAWKVLLRTEVERRAQAIMMVHESIELSHVFPEWLSAMFSRITDEVASINLVLPDLLGVLTPDSLQRAGPFLHATPGALAHVFTNEQAAAFLRYAPLASSSPLPELAEGHLSAYAGFAKGMWAHLSRTLMQYNLDSMLFTLFPNQDNNLMAAPWQVLSELETYSMIHSGLPAMAVHMPRNLRHLGLDNKGISWCGPDSCDPRSERCENTPHGAVCLCIDDKSCAYASDMQFSHRPSKSRRYFTNPAHLQEVVDRVAIDKTIILLTSSFGFNDFLRNWATSARRLGYTNFIVVAEDVDCYNDLQHDMGDQVLLSSSDLFFQEKNSGLEGEGQRGFSYMSSDYNKLVGRRPRYIIELLKRGYNVLYTDIDTVWLESPFAYFDMDADLNIQSDAEEPTTDPWNMLCTGFMYLRNTRGVMDLMTSWLQALIASQGRQVNQYIFNDIVNKQFKKSLHINVLPYNKFPSGVLYFTDEWREEVCPSPAVVHNNFIVGPDRKRARFRRLGLWYIEEQVEDANNVAVSGSRDGFLAHAIDRPSE